MYEFFNDVDEKEKRREESSCIVKKLATQFGRRRRSGESFDGGRDN